MQKEREIKKLKRTAWIKRRFNKVQGKKKKKTPYKIILKSMNVHNIRFADQGTVHLPSEFPQAILISIKNCLSFLHPLPL